MSTLMLDRNREKPSWLIRALETKTDLGASTAPPLTYIPASQPAKQSAKPAPNQTLRQREHTLLTSDPTRAGNPTPNAAVEKLKPPLPPPRDPVLGTKKLVYLHQQHGGQLAMTRSNTSVWKPRTRTLALERMTSQPDSEEGDGEWDKGAWLRNEIRSAPDNLQQQGSRPWVQRQHTVSTCA